MDPNTRAMWELIRQADAFWRANPNRLLPILADEDQREDVVVTLRLYEAQAENRRPMVVFGVPFEGASAYFPKLAEHVEEQYELVRKGVAEEGVELPPFGGDEGTVPSGTLKRAVLAIDKAARRLGDRFDGLVVALVPGHVTDAAGWRECVRVLADTRWSLRVRLAVLAPPGGSLSGILGSEGARLPATSAGLLAFLKQRATGRSAGPTPAADATSLPAPDLEPGAKLQTLLLSAAEAAGARRPIDALLLYREARTLCQVEQLVPQEAAVLMAMGGASVEAQSPDLGAQSYREAAELAQAIEDWALACHAWLGVGGAYLAHVDYASAASAYRAATAAAERAVIVPLRIEALRMTGACLLHLGRQDDAILAWKEAVVVGSEADASEQAASGLEEVAGALVGLLERRGLHPEAQHVRVLMETSAGRPGEHHGP